MARSIEEIVEDWAKGHFAKGSYFTKTASINTEIDDALRKAPSKSGGTGNNYPDIKYLLQTPQGKYIPVMIEVKGSKDALIKLNPDTNTPDNLTKKNEPAYGNIVKYAVNGAVHYANAILKYSKSYNEVLAVGVNGYETATDTVQYEVSVWYISKENLFVPKLVGNYPDLSFLQPTHTTELFDRIAHIGLTDEEIEQEKSKLEDDIERKLKDLNQKMHDELKIVVNQRVQLVTGLIMAGLGVKDGDVFKVKPLQVEELQGNTDEENNDGAVIMSRIKSYLKNKNLPKEKIDMIRNILSVVFEHSQLERPINGESRLRTLYADIQAEIIPFLTGELHNLDFTGRLFNVLNAWVDVPDGAENDVVLTPRFVTELMARLCQVNKDSYVWDFATGSAGFLISSMHQMIADANATIESPQERQRKINHIKMEQLLGIEKLADIYLLAVLNMILMKDGSANIIHGDSLVDFNGKYEQGEQKGKEFPANVFLLNPPYSADGKGFVFVERALEMMHHGGRAAVLIQENAGSTQGLPYTKNILKHNTLLASIKMPIDLFIGKSSVQTAIYVFEVGRPHNVQDVVKFINFSEDGYSRMNRRHSSQSVNLRDTDNAKERYVEVAKLVKYGRGVNDCNLNYYTNDYIEDYITLEGNDWTYNQHQKNNTNPTLDDFGKVVKEYLAWRVSEIIKQEDSLGKTVALA
ncbi:MAG: N-6 DNA methylase [Salinivirgaceae bacterium]|nr:N-6 DNA methylase [Salinivirgaceae bacterium]